jgi:RNA polymerase sigma factor (sigma-70 family)
LDTSPPGHVRAQLDDSEQELIQDIAGQFRTHDRDDLAAELAVCALELKRTRPPGITDWKAYLARVLWNRASNVIRGWRRRDKRVRQQGAESEDLEMPTEPPEAAGTDIVEDRLAISAALDSLDTELRVFWLVLAEENGNQVRTGRRLGMHRNTVRLWIKRIRDVLRTHGYPDL